MSSGENERSIKCFSRRWRPCRPQAFHRGTGVNPGMSGLGAKICQKNHCLVFPICSIHIKTLEIKEIDI